ncbi:MAG: V-type ATP synthase subunit F [Cellulosilyticaceae bacterium]
MYKIAVMGDQDSIYGFAALGFTPYPVNQREEAAKLLLQLVNENYAIIYITEALEVLLESEISKFTTLKLPIIITIPGVFGNTGRGILRVKQSVEQAVGSDIIFNDEKE